MVLRRRRRRLPHDDLRWAGLALGTGAVLRPLALELQAVRVGALDERGRLKVLAESFKEDLRVAEFVLLKGKAELRSEDKAPLPRRIPEIFEALVLGARDYVDKNGFKKALIGLSGGIDSALTAAIAAQALGKDRVVGVTLPSKFSSSATKSDAEKLARRLKKERPELKVICMTGYTDDEVERSGGLTTEFAYLTKPLSSHGLALRVRESLGWL